MSNALFPTLVGLTWNNTKTPMFNTLVQRSVNFRELRGSFTSAPVYSFLLSLQLLQTKYKLGLPQSEQLVMTETYSSTG